MVEETGGWSTLATVSTAHGVRMAPVTPRRPAVASAAMPPADGPALGADPVPPTPSNRRWPEGSAALAEQLQRHLAIGERDWHALKAQRSRRAAEQLAAALVLLLNGDEPGRPSASAARTQALALVEHAAGWLRGEISDPGCPSHGR